MLATDEQEFTADRTIVVQRTFDRIRDSVLRSVSVSREFDYHSRQEAVDKIHAMTVQVGTPKLLRNKKFLKEMYKDITNRKLSEKQKAAAEIAFKAYEETWPTSGTGVQKVVATEPEKAEACPQPATFRLRGTSFLFTYSWDFFQKAFPDGSATDCCKSRGTLEVAGKLGSAAG